MLCKDSIFKYLVTFVLFLQLLSRIINYEVRISIIQTMKAKSLRNRIHKIKTSTNQWRFITDKLSFILPVAKCPPLIPPRNGSFNKCPRDPVYGESCHVTCNIGFKSSEDRPLVCDRDDSGATRWTYDSSDATRWTQPMPECISS